MTIPMPTPTSQIQVKVEIDLTERRLIRHWSDAKAAYLYHLESKRQDGGYWHKVDHTSNKDIYWANAIADHYDIEIPK